MNFYTFNSTLRPASAETIYLQLQSRAKLVLTVHTLLTDFYGFSTPVTHTQVLIEINFQAPKTL